MSMNLQMLNSGIGNILAKIGEKVLGIKKKQMNIIDVSHHNGKINWLTVASQITPFKIDGAIIKVSTGVGSYDPRAVFNAIEAKKAGLKIGYYHYCSLNEEDEFKDSTDEANSFIKVLKILPKSDLGVVLDIEDPKAYPGVNLDPQEVLIWIKNFFAVLDANGYKNYILYSFAPFLNSKLPLNHGLGNIPLWIAQFRTTLTFPRGWNSYWLWQYTDVGRVKGIVGNVDLNKK